MTYNVLSWTLNHSVPIPSPRVFSASRVDSRY